MPDRIETGTFLVAAAITGGKITIKNTIPEHVDTIIQKLREAGAEIKTTSDSIILDMKGKINWVWVDCFTKNPLTPIKYKLLKEAGFKLCFVSPELQNQSKKLELYRDYFIENNIKLDMICTKYYNIDKWTLIKSDVQIIIPMSGVGQRFVDAGYKTPKPLIIVDNKPIIKPEIME